MIEVLAYFELRIIHTSDRKCDSPFESVEKRHGCVWVACQSNMHVCCLRFLCMCSARYYRWKWLEGHTSSAPQNMILRSSHSYTDFVAWFARIVTGKHLCTVIWDAHFKLRFATWFGIHTVFFCVFWILIQNAHLELKFKIRTLPSCENSLYSLKTNHKLFLYFIRQLCHRTKDLVNHAYQRSNQTSKFMHQNIINLESHK